jgi:uncharacterized protein (DUF1697 family)
VPAVRSFQCSLFRQRRHRPVRVLINPPGPTDRVRSSPQTTAPYPEQVPSRILLLRGINIGANNRIAMPRLRELLTDAGMRDVRTYVQSGNVVLTSSKSPERLARACEQQILKELGLSIDVVARTRDELAEVVERNPLGDVAENPKRYQVSFLSAELAPDVIEKLEALAVDSERFVAIGRELYAWHPEGVARSKLWAGLAAKGLGVTATARNWTTVTTLLQMADE